ncbi:Disease resistance protein [Artemisia annua]|uniref:Disease resistance protein n=1 Tax=Artemisia annua TaxID=35608 RepID=A0A2U1PLX8_ARTAN|nr:Disease resistance protein [Artemisia annua]
MKLARSEGIDTHLKKWKNSLQLIQDVLADAGQKHITQRSVESWLHELQDLAYDIDDVIDDMAFETLRRKLNQEPQASTSTSKLLKIIPTCCTNYTPHKIMYGRKISSKLDEITKKLRKLVEEKNNLGLDVNVKNERSRRLEETSLVDKSNVFGREVDKEALLEKLLVDESKVSVVSIVGLGGIGKTTLAKVLYNDEKVEAYFDLRAWVCVSEEFDIFKISKAVFQAVTGENKDFANLDLLHVALKEKLSRKKTEVFEKLRHFSFVSQPNLVYRKFKELHRAKCLRTFLPVSVGLEHSFAKFCSVDDILVELMPQLKFLRVLSLTFGSIKEVPQSIGSLIHLRYLNFSGTRIKQIPEQVSDLYNLQSLLVHDCEILSTLPASFVKLINLRHLDIGGTRRLKKMPLGIGGLTGLQTLSKVCIEGDNGFQISELKDLLDLQGRLVIEGLDKVTDPTQATDASYNKRRVLMIWILYGVSTLMILGTQWLNMNWVGDSSFDQLTELVLEGCRNCTHLPTLGQLSSLRKLSVKRMHEVKTVGPFKGIALPSLESLEVEDMQGLEMWSTAISFPHLQEISIKECPKLEKLFGDKGLTRLQGEVLKHLGAVEILDIKYCGELKYLWESESVACTFLVSLRRLFVYNCNSLVSLTEKEVNVGSSMESVGERGCLYITLGACTTLQSYNCPNSVERLSIWDCSSLSCLTFSKLHKFPSSPNFCLKYLEITRCENLNSFPHEHLQSFTSLEEMEIHDCPNMDYSFPCGLWPPNLKELRIGYLKKPMLEWGLQNYPTSLVTLVLVGKDSGVVSFEVEENASNATSKSFLLPSSLTSLSVSGFTEVESFSEVLQHLTRLEELIVYSCPKIRDLPESSSSLRVIISCRTVARIIKVVPWLTNGLPTVSSKNSTLVPINQLLLNNRNFLVFKPIAYSKQYTDFSRPIVYAKNNTLVSFLKPIVYQNNTLVTFPKTYCLPPKQRPVRAVVNVLVEKLISGDFMKLPRSEGIDSQLKKWKNSLQLIQVVLADAGEKHITQKPVELLLHDLQDLAYDIDDVLDDMCVLL